MPLPNQPVTLTAEQVAELHSKLRNMCHRINNKLAVDRAEHVKDMLIRQGINPGLISVSSHGKYDPAIPTPDGVAEARNRRVEVIVQ